MQAVVARRTVHVGLCSNIAGLRGEVEKAFQASRLSAGHELVAEEIGDGCASEVEILLADPGKVVGSLERLPKLRWLQSSWAGVNALAGHGRRDYKCTRLAGCFGPQMSEFVFGAMFDEDWRRLRFYQEREEWAPEPFKKRPRLSDLTLGILGVGDIPSVIAQRAKAFGMRTLGFASRAREVPGFDDVVAELPRVLGEADVVVNVLPSTAETRGLLNNGALKACGTGKLFINVGRGDVVSEDALVEALDEGWLRGAVLDVFATEPLPGTSALWRHPGVRISPHVAAVSYPSDVAQLFVANLELWLDGKPLRYMVDLDKGY
mmetsp:Transcript_104477/g.280740  ORF Transcript_104477/g.280740 Transcript_104477/m.280740 type:complete len:320 (-) Transcript_104477:97-1056(-)